MSPAAATSVEGVGSALQPQATRRTATVVRMTPVAVVLLVPTHLISCRSRMSIRYPRDLWRAMIPITRPSRETPTNYWPNPCSERCPNPFPRVSEGAFSLKFVARFPNHTVGSCLIYSKEGKLSILEHAPKAGRLLLSHPERRRA